ncbi:MAG: A24 family peptidase [Candidatus Cloacimonadaceae bacterium]
MIFILLFWRFQDNVFLFIKYSTLFIFLIPIFFIDFYHRLILDKLTIPLAIVGLAFALFPYNDISWLNALLTGVGVLVLMLLIAWLFEKVRHKEGMGGGDIKLLAALATFLGVLNLSFIIFFSSVIAVVAALTASKTREQGVPFGPFLVISNFIWIMFGYHFLGWYLGLL